MKSIFICLVFFFFIVKLQSQQDQKSMEQVLIQKVNTQVQNLEYCQMQLSNTRVRPNRYGNIMFNSITQVLYDFFFTQRPFIASFRTSISQSLKKWLGFKPNQQCRTYQKQVINKIGLYLQQLFSYIRNRSVYVSLNKVKLGQQRSKIQYKQKCLMFLKIGENLKVRSDLQQLLVAEIKRYFDRVGKMSQEQVKWQNDQF